MSSVDRQLFWGKKERSLSSSPVRGAWWLQVSPSWAGSCGGGFASCSPREQSPCSGKGKLGLPATAPELLQILLCVPELLSYLTLCWEQLFARAHLPFSRCIS